MKKVLTFFLWLCIPLYCLSQNPLPREYDYDNAGNRTMRKVVQLAPPSPPEDSLYVPSNELRATTYELHDEYFVEKIAQIEMKIYPNPATEKITLSISNMGNLETGILQLYSLSGQLLQTQPISSETTEVSLSEFPKGVYILNVRINDTTEDWKIIKQ
jgi:hypothetical protein